MKPDQGPASLVVLMYHAVLDAPLSVPDWCFMTSDSFRAQMEHLARSGRIVPLNRALNRAPWTAPTPAIAVTFDDGFRNNLDVALPILTRFEIPATVFLPTAFVDNREWLWFCRVNSAVTASKRTSCDWQDERYDLSSIAHRSDASARMQARLKTYPQPELLRQLSTLCASLGEEEERPVDEWSPYATLDSRSIRQMMDTGLMDFGAHSHSHAILSLLDPDSRTQEITQSISRVGDICGRRCSLFAYPNGRRQDYDVHSIAVLREREIDAAFTAIGGTNDESTARMELRRVGVGAETSLDEFQSTLRELGCV